MPAADDGIDWHAILTALDGSVPGASSGAAAAAGSSSSNPTAHGGLSLAAAQAAAQAQAASSPSTAHPSPVQPGLWDLSSSGRHSGHHAHAHHHHRTHSQTQTTHSGPPTAKPSPASSSLPPTPHPGLGLSDEELFAHFAHSFNPAIPPSMYNHHGGHGGGPNWPPPPAGPSAHSSPRGLGGTASAELNQRIAMAHGTHPYQHPLAGSATSAPPSTPSGPPTWNTGPASDRPRPQRTLTSSSAITSSRAGSPGPGSAPAETPNGEDVEDKRIRNTLASARFRAKKKQHVETVERSIRDLEAQHRELEIEVNDLRKENGLLKEMVQLKYGARQP
ncbi:hypothetical protein Q8F55_003842 [Vanrija albida]|uniref:BZIP domain-containing protein n=1 Tax=Vanrija albida TaxID=181172 RepID=A0ABR3Q592_9TREE